MSGRYTRPGPAISVLAWDARSGATGIAIAASAVAIGARCPHLAAEQGAVSTQGFANLKIGPLALDLLRRGLAAREVLEALRQHDRWIAYRQIAILSARGDVEVHTGEMNTGWAGHRIGAGGAVLGNGLPGPGALDAMEAAFAVPRPLDARLLATLEAGAVALGHDHHMASAALRLGTPDGAAPPEPASTAQLDLRVDLVPPERGGDAVEDLRRLFEVYRPLEAFYERRSLSPQP